MTVTAGQIAADPNSAIQFNRSPPPANTFEIGLVLAGAVSAGAYTAGVIDYFIEAMDAWQAAKIADIAAGRTGERATVPHHNVVLRIVTGASAGGMNGAIAAAALRHAFPHARQDAPLHEQRANPFYSAWVEQVDIDRFLRTDDLARDKGVLSLLDCTQLKEIVQGTLAMAGPPADPAVRAWVADPLLLLLTVTNLRGLRYAVRFQGDGASGAHAMVMHRDHLAFSVEGLGAGPAGWIMPGALGLGPDRTDKAWETVGKAALATGAFPVALRPVVLERRGSDYATRGPYWDETGQVNYDAPIFSEPDAPYSFLCVDGGAMDNEPFELARVVLAGTNGKNPREADKANRAVIMVDPFVDAAVDGPQAEAPILQVGRSLLSAYKDQARFTPGDWTLIKSGDVYSRFMVAPSRKNSRGEQVDGAKAIASGGLGGFLGFFCRDYREHDYMLGRRNCQRFLQAVLTLAPNNPVFAGVYSAEAKQRFAARGRPSDHLQLIPCALPEEPQPRWPARRFVPGRDLEKRIEARLKAVARALAAEHITGEGTFWSKLRGGAALLYLTPVIRAAKTRLVAAALDQVRTAAAEVDREHLPQ